MYVFYYLQIDPEQKLASENFKTRKKKKGSEIKI